MFWDGVVHRLGAEIPPFVVEAWVQPLIAETSGERLRLVCPSELHRERIRERFLDRLKKLAASEAGRPIEIDLEIAGGKPTARDTPPTPAVPSTPKQTTPPDPAEPKHRSRERRPMKRGVQPRIQRELPYTFENFVVGTCNQLAREASLAVAHGTQQTVNPLFLVSASGLGKTHLARASTPGPCGGRVAPL